MQYAPRTGFNCLECILEPQTGEYVYVCVRSYVWLFCLPAPAPGEVSEYMRKHCAQLTCCAHVDPGRHCMDIVGTHVMRVCVFVCGFYVKVHAFRQSIRMLFVRWCVCVLCFVFRACEHVHATSVRWKTRARSHRGD